MQLLATYLTESCNCWLPILLALAIYLTESCNCWPPILLALAIAGHLFNIILQLLAVEVVLVILAHPTLTALLRVWET
jgi:hypothetical protein